MGIDGSEKLIDEVVQFEKAVHANGMKFIEFIYKAIKSKQGITFNYRNIYKNKTSATSLIPYLIKEHRNRWYVIGWSSEKEKYTTYALDRMSGVETTDTIYKRRSDFNASTFFQHSTGIMESKAKPEEVLLTIQSPISNLLLLEPLHSTQKVIVEKPDAIQISLKVLLNEEFTFKLLGMGSFCIVNKPASLKKTIKNAISLMNANYL